MTTLKEMLSLLDGTLLTPGLNLGTECQKVFASDLMSDVLAFMDPGSVLLTGLVNSHVVRTACLVDATAIIIVQGKQPDQTVVDEAGKNNLPIVSTKLPMFETCSRISRFFPEGSR